MILRSLAQLRWRLVKAVRLIRAIEETTVTTGVRIFHAHTEEEVIIMPDTLHTTTIRIVFAVVRGNQMIILAVIEADLGNLTIVPDVKEVGLAIPITDQVTIFMQTGIVAHQTGVHHKHRYRYRPLHPQST